ncbi:coiled-coil domain-containing protein 170-like [Peromyscus eremicus]|uniref:coiled-coil domain-containing protein 170-like n=1 Tax=Peromyscus eremicus TaxID=42410 RepID=UPI0027DB04C6|nr:coiled-coil domain-containing protein 170-like [Peromyscus eremicus]
MSRPLQSLTHSDPGRLANSQTKEACEAKPSEARHQSLLSARENVPVLRNIQNKIFIKETSLQEMKTELESYKESNAQQLLQIMSLRDDVKNLQDLIASLMKVKILQNTNSQNIERGNWDLTERVTDLENRLREHLVERERMGRKAELEKRWPCSSRFSPCPNLKGPEDSLDIFPVKDNGEVSNFERDIIYSEGPIDEQDVGGKCPHDLTHKEKLTSEFDRPPYSCSWETTPEQAHHQDFLGQLATLLSDSIGPILATEEAVKERIQEMGANEQLWKSKSEALQQEIQTLTKKLEQLYHLYEEAAERSPQTEESYTGQKRPLQHLEEKGAVSSPLRSVDMGRKKENSRTRTAQADKHRKFKQLEVLLDIEQNSKMTAGPGMEEKIQKLQKQLSDLKLSNKNMKTQLTRINVLKDKTIERLRQSVTKVETGKEKAAAQTDNLKTLSDPAEPAAGSEKERARQTTPAHQTPAHQTMPVHQMTPPRGPPEPSATRSTPKGVSGREQELADFRETIMKLLGFNVKTADKEVINQLKLVIQVYEISNKSKTASHCETGQDK